MAVPLAYSPRPIAEETAAGSLFEDLGANMAARYAQAETDMIAEVARYARKGIAVPPSVTERLDIARALRAKGQALADNLKNPDVARRLVAIAAEQGEAAAVARLNLGDVATGPITPAAANAVALTTLDLTNNLDKMSDRITRWMPDAYQKVIAMTSSDIHLGTATLQQSQQRAAEQFLARGVRGFTDSAGKEWRIGSYAEMATRTSVNRAWMNANVQAMQEHAGINLVTIIIGANACSKCASHAGKIYSTDGTPGGTYQLESEIGDGLVTVTVAGTLDQARATGWNHPNCRCVVVAYLAGLPVPHGSTYNPQGEKDRDRLRQLERRVRDLKRREQAAFSDIDKKRLRGRIKSAQGDIRQHVADTGIARSNYREQLGFSDGRPPKLPPAPKPRPVADPPALPPAPTVAAPSRIPTKAPTPIVAPIAASPDIRAALTAAKTVPEMAKIIQGEYGIQVTGFTAAQHPDSAREIAQTVADMVDKYPGVNLTHIGIRKLSGSTIARATGKYGPSGRLESMEINVNSAYTAAANREASLLIFKQNSDAGHFHEGAATGGFRYTVAHEFGHTMDYAGQKRIRSEIAKIRADVDPTRTLASGYGNKQVGELIAEAFADVEVNGARANRLSKAIHTRMIAIYNEETGR